MPANMPRPSKIARKMEHVSKKEKMSSIKRLLGYVFKYYPLQFFFVCIFILISSGAGVVGSFLLGKVSDEADILAKLYAQSSALDFSTFNILIIIMAAVYVAGILSTFLYNRMMVVLGQGVQKKIRDEMFNHMQDLPISYFDSRSHGDIMSIYTNDVDALREMLSRILPMVVSSFMTMIIAFVMMIITSWLLTIVVLVFGIAIFYFAKFFATKGAKYFIAQQVALGHTNGYIEEMTSGQKVIKVFNYEKRAEEGFNTLNDQLFDYGVKASRFTSVLMPTVNQLGNLQYALLGVLGVVGIVNSVPGITIGAVVSFLLYSKTFTQPIGQISQQLNIIALALAGSTRIFKLIDEPVEKDQGYVELVNALEGKDGSIIETKERTGRWAWKHPHHEGKVDYTWLKGKIDFHNVDFAYVPGKLVLHEIDLYAKPGQKIAFVGPTGAGKTTIANLINRFYDIEDGKIRYDDININKIKKADLRRSLGVVLQEVKLFTGTVKENIAYGKEDATDEEIQRAAKLANADSFIDLLPQGYDTMLENAGLSLSQGQRQLLSIARCAVADPPVMILDEATSSIDSRTEALVQEGMDRLMEGRTVFVIAHRLSTIQNSDVIMVLDAGKIIERGTHQELLDKKGKYYQLYTGNKAIYEN